jgi:hypothetical protein
MGDDPFRVYVPEHPGIINLNDDMQEMQNAPQWVANVQGPLSQEGRHFQWQLPIPPIPIQPPIPIPIQPPIPRQPSQPPVPSQPPAQIVAGVRHAAATHHTARQSHPRHPTKLWCTKNSHWVESAVFGRLLTCKACWAAHRARAARLRNERLALEAQVAAQQQLAAQIGANDPQNLPVNNPPPLPPPLPLPPVDVLSAISQEDKILLKNCRNELMLSLMVILDLRHLHGKVLIHPGFQLYLQLHDGRPKQEKLWHAHNIYWC